MARNPALANEQRTRESVRGDAWRCGSREVVRAMSWRKLRNVQKFISKVTRLVTTKLLSVYKRDTGCHAFREQFVTYA